jgi:hypothetical protein
VIPWLLALWLGCAPELLSVEVIPTATGVQISANEPLVRIDITDDRAAPVVTRRLPGPTHTVAIQAPLTPGATYTVSAQSVGQIQVKPVTIPARGPLSVTVEAPLGSPTRTPQPNETFHVDALGMPTAAITIVAHEAGPHLVKIGSRTAFSLSEGQREVHTLALAEETEIHAGNLSFRLSPRTLDRETARLQLKLDSVVFPADSMGHTDPSRPPNRIQLPSAWWRRGLRLSGFGYRPRSDQAPWSYAAVTLTNTTDTPQAVVVTQRVLDGNVPASAFRPRLREMDGDVDRVTALLQVPASSQATAALPVYVDGASLPVHTRSFTHELTITPLASDMPLHTVRTQLAVRRGSTWASAGFVGLLATALAGWLAVLFRGRRWLAALHTTQLVTVALFGSLSFVVGSASQLLGLGVASALGPFAPLLMGLVDDALRMALLATLVTLVPRVGVVSLATLIGYLMRGLALGAFHPVDALYLGATVFWLESFLWLAGLTRQGARKNYPWLRLTLGFGLSNVGAVASSLVVSVVMYRLYFAAWYVALLLVLPGFLYMAWAAWWAVPFARSLRDVQS